MSRPCCLPRRLICTSGCRWCSRLLNVSFGPSAWFSLSLFLFIYLIYQFVTQMNNGWGGLLPRRHAKLIIVTRSLTKIMSTILLCLQVTPPPPLLGDTRVDVSARSVSAVIESWQPCTSRHWSGRSIRKWHIEIYMSIWMDWPSAVRLNHLAITHSILRMSMWLSSFKGTCKPCTILVCFGQKMKKH